MAKMVKATCSKCGEQFSRNRAKDSKATKNN